MSARRVIAIGSLFLWVAGVASALRPPAAVSPGDPSKVVRAEPCPTFNWGAVAGAESYRLVVYRLDGRPADLEEAVLETVVPGSALGWTPSLDDCLERGGRYAWSVRADGPDARGEGSEWSAPRFFEVSAAPTAAELEAALDTVRRYLAAQGEAAQAEAATSSDGEVGLRGREIRASNGRPKRDPGSDPVEQRVAGGAVAATKLSVDGGVAATSFTGDGSTLTSLDPANLEAGTAAIDVSGTAANVTGTVAVANGGTGANDAAGARTALGVAAGPHTADTTCNGAACDGSAFTNVTAVAGDSATGFFSEGRIEEARIADEIARDSEIGTVALCTGLLPATGRRYLDLGDGTVLDCASKALWLKDATCADLPGTDAQGRGDYITAESAAAALADGLCGLTDGSSPGDWELPTAVQLCSAFSGSSLLPCPASASADSLIDSSLADGRFFPPVANTLGTGAWSEGDPFVGVEFEPIDDTRQYWSQTIEGGLAWYADLEFGDLRGDATGAPLFFVWPVRTLVLSVELDPERLVGLVPIDKGGTGASSASGARANLGVAGGSHTVDTTCNGAACNGASFTNVTAVAGDSATGFFPAGRIEENRIAETLLRDTELLGSSPKGAQLLLCATRNRGGWRYWDLGDGTVLDCNTGILWMKDADCLGSGTWSATAAAGSVQETLAALNAGTDFGCQDYAPGTYSDWRLPEVSEFCSAGAVEQQCPATNAPDSLLDSSVGFSPTVVNSTGTGKASPNDPFVDLKFSSPADLYWSGTPSSASAWRAYLNNGTVGKSLQTDVLRAWAVRGGR